MIEEEQLPLELSKRGRKPKNPALGAMTPAQRKREQRARQAEAAATGEVAEFTDADCLAVLNGKRWRNGAIDKAAWLRLGQLRGFLTDQQVMEVF